MSSELGLRLLLSLAAFVAGFIDAIGGGGGLVTLPALLAAGLPPAVAIATNKGQAAPGALSSFLTYLARGGIDRRRLPLGFAAGFAGSLLGAALLLALPVRPLRPLVIVLLLAAAAVVLLRGRVRPRTRTLACPRCWLAGIGLALGAYDGFFGPGTGSLLIIAFMLAFGDTPLAASGNAKVVNLASNLAAFGLFALRGSMQLSLCVPMAVANVLGARLGAMHALRGGDRLVRGVVLLVVVLAVVKLTSDGLR